MTTETRKHGWQLIVERFPGARCIWDVCGPKMIGDASRGRGVPMDSELRAYSINGCIVIVHDYPDGNGWQVYTATTESGDISKTLDAIDARTRGVDYDYKER